MSIEFIIAGISLCIMATLVMVAWNNSTRWLTSILIPILCIMVYFGWEASKSLKGIPTDIMPEGEWILIGAAMSQQDYIYVTVVPVKSSVPVLVRIPWTAKSAQKLEAALQAMCQGSTVSGKGTEALKDTMKNGVKASNHDKNVGYEDEDMIELYEFNVESRSPKR